MRFPAKENAGWSLVAQKHRAFSRQEKMASSPPVGLPGDSPPPPLESARADGRTGGRAYADVRTKISRIDRLPNVPIYGDPLCGFRPQRSSAIKQVLCFKFLYFCKCIACFSPQTLPVHLPTPLQCQKKNHM